MSNAVFPVLPGLKWGVVRHPSFSTTKKKAVNGREYRAANMIYPEYVYKLSYEFLRDLRSGVDELRTLEGFFLSRYGSYDSFLWTDPDDNSVTAQQIGTGDGTTTAFQLVRSWGGFVEPVYNLASPPVITYGGQNANLVMNSSFETHSGGHPYGYGVYNGAGISVTLTAPAGRTGGVAYGLRANAATSSTLGIYTWASLNETGSIKSGVRGGGWKPGVSYVVSFYARKVNGAAWSTMSLYWNTAPAAVTAISNPALSSSWQRYVFKVDWGSSVEINGGLYISIAHSSVANDEIQIDDLQVVFGDSAPAYVAGDQSYTYDAAGLVTFDAAPAAAVALGWSGTYYKRVRFDLDYAEYEKFMAQLWSAKSVDLRSVKP